MRRLGHMLSISPITEVGEPIGHIEVPSMDGLDIVDDQERSVVRPVGYERLVLSGCHPLYSAEKRYIVFARMTSEQIRGG